MNDIYSIPKAADRCGLHRVTLWKYVKAGEIKTFKTPGGQHRIHKEDLEAFMKQKGMYPFFQKPPSGKKVLIVDDDEKIRKLLFRALKAHRYDLDYASDGFEAGLKLLTFKPHLIILDLVMPKLDGFSVCEMLKKDAATSAIKIIAISGFDTPQNREKILNAGADFFLPKPLDMKVLRSKIKTLLA